MSKELLLTLATGCIKLGNIGRPSPWQYFAFTGRVSRQQAVCSLYFHPVYWS